MHFSFTLKDKVLFYLSYFTRKVFCIWFEVKRPKFKMFIYEMLYSFRKLFNYHSAYPSPFKVDIVETKFGKFKVRQHTVDMSNASPAFERRDIDYLLNIIQHLADRNKKILFMDIGADIGTFSITVGNRFKYQDNVSIISFEPSPSYELLRENLALNSLSEKVIPYNFALGSKEEGILEMVFNPEAPGSSGRGIKVQGAKVLKVPIKSLDSVAGDLIGKFDSIVIKMDVEGMEEDILTGSKNILNSKKEIYLLVEDFIKPSIINYLEDIGAVFIKKLTPYNSFWKL